MKIKNNTLLKSNFIFLFIFLVVVVVLKKLKIYKIFIIILIFYCVRIFSLSLSLSFKSHMSSSYTIEIWNKIYNKFYKGISLSLSSFMNMRLFVTIAGLNLRKHFETITFFCYKYFTVNFVAFFLIFLCVCVCMHAYKYILQVSYCNARCGAMVCAC